MRIGPRTTTDGTREGNTRRSRVAVGVIGLGVVAALLAACSGSSSSAPPSGQTASTASSAGSASSSPAGTSAAASGYSKVMVIVEENQNYSQILRGGDAPYITQLSKSYGSATNMDAGDPVSCPSLPSYLLMTSGSRYGVCDDNDPSDHPISAPNIFQQVTASGRQ